MDQALKRKIRQAVKQGGDAYVMSLCRDQGDIDAAARYAIDVAITSDKESLVDQLVPLLSKSFEVYPLDAAAKAGSVRAVEQLIEFCDAEDDDALVLAAGTGTRSASNACLESAALCNTTHLRCMKQRVMVMLMWSFNWSCSQMPRRRAVEH